MPTTPMVFDIEGRKVVVEPHPGGWRGLMSEHDRPEREFRVPNWLMAEEIPRFLMMVFGVAAEMVKRV